MIDNNGDQLFKICMQVMFLIYAGIWNHQLGNSNDWELPEDWNQMG